MGTPTPEQMAPPLTTAPPAMYSSPASFDDFITMTDTYEIQLAGVQGQLKSSVASQIHPSPWAPDRVFNNDYDTYTAGTLPYLCNVVYGTSGFSSATAAQQWIGATKSRFQTDLPYLGYSGINVTTTNGTYVNKYQNITYNSVTFTVTCMTPSNVEGEMLWTLYY